MTAIEKDLLRIYRVFGPCEAKEAARRLGASPLRTSRVSHYMVLKELLMQVGGKWSTVFDVSEQGRDEFARQLFRGTPAARTSRSGPSSKE